MSNNTGIKRQSSFEHLEFCNRLVRRSVLKYPWDLNLQYNPHCYLDGVRPAGMVPLTNNRLEHGDADDEMPAAPPVLCKKFWMKQPRIDWEVKLNAVRESAIIKWQKIVSEGPTVFEVSRYFFLSVKEGMETGTLFDCLKNVFASKSTSTLNSRVGPMVRYVFYCKSSQQEAFPLVESVVYAYMLHEESKPGAAPTYLRSFVSSMAFCHYVMGLLGAKSIVESKRITGLAYKMYLKKRKTSSRAPFKISEVKILESVLAGAYNRSWADRHAAGCFLFMIYARARFSDMMNVGCISLEAHEISGERFGYVEAEVTRSKTSYSLERRVRLLPMSATIKGISNFFWADEWFAVMKKADIKVGPGKPLLPGRTPDGWHTLPLSAEAGTHWLRTLLLLDPGFEKERWPKLGTHSAKSTCLSWMSKWGTSPEVRRLMGYHVGDKCSTMMIYGKDNTSAGLRELDTIIAAIRAEDFRPDFPRACMFSKGWFSSANNMDQGEDAGRKDDDVSDDDSSSVDSADEDEPDHAELEAAEDAVIGRWDGGVDIEKLPTGASFSRHNISRIIHLSDGGAAGKFVCGREASLSYFALESRPQILVPVCKQCFEKFALKR